MLSTCWRTAVSISLAATAPSPGAGATKSLPKVALPLASPTEGFGGGGGAPVGGAGRGGGGAVGGAVGIRASVGGADGIFAAGVVPSDEEFPDEPLVAGAGIPGGPAGVELFPPPRLEEFGLCTAVPPAPPGTPVLGIVTQYPLL